MLIGSSLTDVFVWTDAIDMRKSIDGLCGVVSDYLLENPGSGKVYVFFNKGRDKLKLIYWDSNGFCLLYKRLEKGRFQIQKGEKIFLLNRVQLEILLQGLPVVSWPQKSPLIFEKYA